MTNLSTSNFLTDGFGDVNVTAASDAATDFVINNGAGNGTNYYGLSSFAYFIGFNMLFTFLAFIPVAYRPVSGGSGIAEAKATLNGIILPTCTDLLTACCKAVSVIFAGAASLPIGLEGPLIFIGLAIGHNAQRFIPNSYNQLKLDEMKRDFAVVGCACGVAGAFLTPIGGVLFAMEEGASFWSALLAWRSFAAACVTTITLYVLDWVLALIKAAISGEDTTNDVPSFRVYDFLLFAVIGILAGIVGSLWIEANSYITTLRRRVGLNRVGKLIELLTLSILTTCIFWFLPLLYTRCTAMEAIQTIDTSILRQMNCPDGYYNQLGTLFLNPPGGIGLNLLYWEDGIEAFDAGPLAIAGFTYHILLLLLFGTSTAMGIFIPLLFAGACYGRAFGVMIIYHTDFFPDDGVSGHREAVMTTYTMVCSVALLAGVVRVLISLTVIMVCSIGVTYLVTPFMVATLFAKVVGKAMFGRPGIYDVIIETRGMPFLETECPKNVIMRGLCAKDIMSRPLLVALEPEQRIGQLLEYLRRNPDFDDYPVIDSSHGGILLGVITKRDILTLLSHRELFYQPQKEEMANNDSATMPPPLLGTKQKSQRVALNFDQLIYERVKKVDVDIDTVLNIITEEDRDKVLDVTPYLEIGHYTVNQFVSVHRTFQLFRSLGLRYLIVTDAFGRPIGVITRHDLKLLEDVGMDEEQYVRRLSELSLNNEIDTSYRS
ncbi:Voltage_CLC-domain-containing protein [Fragilariopsis cylindrus CCMP1102]|uniref:Chloride channel protein n=1 Tax=Fragilariopsis cylindrus CCMP1102 TaxID=635003 RepID=A0A1E7F460_9STRA|nr:Voltage_CLC-domain-containing protein [Fragilariopsis cylindrus CCMP1102]|eukprot:OEU12785.1 Voltage_CLC-domain-containing protein [Fragilariopsis cylindrus CCMP1102]